MRKRGPLAHAQFLHFTSGINYTAINHRFRYALNAD